MRRKKHRVMPFVVLGLAALAGVWILIQGITLQGALREAETRLASYGAQVLVLPQGQISYVDRGEGPVVLVSHGICDRIAFIAEGRIVTSGTVPQLMESVSHGHAIQFVTDKNIDSLPVDLQACFKGSKVTVRPDHSLVMASDQRIPLFPVMEFFHKNIVEVYEARELRPSLEDVFVKLTGIESSVLKKDKEKGGRQ